jgi:hypothetical protein
MRAAVGFLRRESHQRGLPALSFSRPPGAWFGALAGSVFRPAEALLIAFAADTVFGFRIRAVGFSLMLRYTVFLFEVVQQLFLGRIDQIAGEILFNLGFGLR